MVIELAPHCQPSLDVAAASCPEGKGAGRHDGIYALHNFEEKNSNRIHDIFVPAK
jgi:hypothetical protein